MRNEIIIVSLNKKFKKQEKELKKAAVKLFQAENQKNVHLEIYLVGNKFMNKNVLSFPAPVAFPRPDLRKKNLGEIYLNPEYIKNHKEDLTFMLIHGFLHLLNYNHRRKSDRIIMEKKEKKLCQIIL